MWKRVYFLQFVFISGVRLLNQYYSEVHFQQCSFWDIFHIVCFWNFLQCVQCVFLHYVFVVNFFQVCIYFKETAPRPLSACCRVSQYILCAFFTVCVFGIFFYSLFLCQSSGLVSTSRFFYSLFFVKKNLQFVFLVYVLTV